MTLTRAFAFLLVLTALYLGVLAWTDIHGGVFSHVSGLGPLALTLCTASFASYVLRYVRWQWLLSRSGNGAPVLRGFLAYLAGFALTATPGKVGELLRVRYFAQQRVPASKVIAAFMFERALDLVVVMALASLYVTRRDVWMYVGVFVVGSLSCVVAALWRPVEFSRLGAWLHARGAVRIARPVLLLGEGFAEARVWLTVPDLLVALGCGFAAWLLISWAFVDMLAQLVAPMPVSAVQVLAMYPLAMLAGAASLLPGGIGSTEAALTALQVEAGIPVAVAIGAAIGIRLATLWFAIACGLISAALLEWRLRPH